MASEAVVTIEVTGVPEVAAMLRVLVSGLRLIEARAAAGASAKELGQIAHRASSVAAAPPRDEGTNGMSREEVERAKMREDQLTQAREALERLSKIDPLDESNLPFIDAPRELQARIEFAANALATINRGETEA